MTMGETLKIYCFLTEKAGSSNRKNRFAQKNKIQNQTEIFTVCRTKLS